MRELLIIGAGGFGAVAASVADDINAAASKLDHAAPWDVIGYADVNGAKRGTQHVGYRVYGTIEEVGRAFSGRELWYLCAIGDNAARASMAQLAAEFKWKPATLVHPSAVVANTAEVGPGSYIGPGSVIAVNAKIGAQIIVDMHVSIGHDAVLADYCEVLSGARINGNCSVGRYALIGSNATLMPGTIVGDRAVVGPNSVAHGRVEPDTTLFGVPARIIRRSSDS